MTTDNNLISDLHHDLKNPMAAIKLLCGLLLAGKAGALTKKQQELVKDISEANERMITRISEAKKTSI